MCGAWLGQRRPQQRHRVRPGGEAHRLVVGDHPLPRGSWPAARGVGDGVQRQRQLAAAPGARCRRISHSSRRRSASRTRRSAPARTSCASCVAADAARAAPGRRDRRRGRRRSRSATTSSARLADALDVAEADPDGAAAPRPCSRRRLRLTSGGEHRHAPPLAVAQQRRRRVEAHRLGVQERAQELGRVVRGAATPTGRRGSRRRRRATWGSRTPRSRRTFSNTSLGRLLGRRRWPPRRRGTAASAPRAPRGCACGSSPGAATRPPRW